MFEELFLISLFFLLKNLRRSVFSRRLQMKLVCAFSSMAPFVSTTVTVAASGGTLPLMEPSAARPFPLRA